MDETKVKPMQPILPDALYPLRVFTAITGLGEYALRTARRNGMKIHRMGGRSFVFGADFIRFLRKQGGEQ